MDYNPLPISRWVERGWNILIGGTSRRGTRVLIEGKRELGSKKKESFAKGRNETGSNLHEMSQEPDQRAKTHKPILREKKIPSLSAESTDPPAGSDAPSGPLPQPPPSLLCVRITAPTAFRLSFIHLLQHWRNPPHLPSSLPCPPVSRSPEQGLV